MILLALFCALCSFALFGCSTDAHHLRAFGDRPSARRRNRMRQVAWVSLAISAVATILARGWTFGPVVWVGIVMLAAGAVFLCLNFTPSRKGIGR